MSAAAFRQAPSPDPGGIFPRPAVARSQCPLRSESDRQTPKHDLSLRAISRNGPWASTFSSYWVSAATDRGSSFEAADKHMCHLRSSTQIHSLVELVSEERYRSVLPTEVEFCFWEASMAANNPATELMRMVNGYQVSQALHVAA